MYVYTDKITHIIVYKIIITHLIVCQHAIVNFNHF